MPVPEAVMIHGQPNFDNKLPRYLNKNTLLSFHENTFDNAACKMVTIFSNFDVLVIPLNDAELTKRRRRNTEKFPVMLIFIIIDSMILGRDWQTRVFQLRVLRYLTICYQFKYIPDLWIAIPFLSSGLMQMTSQYLTSNPGFCEQTVLYLCTVRGMFLQWANQHNSRSQCHGLPSRSIIVTPVARRNGLILDSKLFLNPSNVRAGHVTFSNEIFLMKLLLRTSTANFSNDVKYKGAISSTRLYCAFNTFRVALTKCTSGRDISLFLFRLICSNKSNPRKYYEGIYVMLLPARIRIVSVFAKGWIGGAFATWQFVI